MKRILFVIAVCMCLLSCSEKRDGVEYFYTKAGKPIGITLIKHASLQITYNGKEYEIDPVSSAIRPIVDYTDKPQADYILVTHDHYDHFDMNAIFLLTKKNTNLILPLRCFNRYKSGTVMRNDYKAQIDDDVWLYSVPAYNITPKYRHVHPRGVGNGYVLDFDGFRIYIAGDTEYVPEMKNLKNIDVAFLPCDKRANMSMAQLRKAAMTIKPKVIYPYQTSMTKDEEIRKELKGLNIDVRIRYMK